jgi:DNA-binding NtrC family response regulator
VYDSPGIGQRIGQPTMDNLVSSVPRAVARRVASTDCSLLVTGETGVGKGYLARWIHDRSPRRAAPFVPVNCGAIPEGIVDSHLFGHTRGAFSDAHRDHPGLVRAAEGGTLFLDEVGDLPHHAQRRLLRLLEEREVQPVGASRPTAVNVRIIAATARDLRELVDERRFRLDLFFRLNVIQFAVRPLRQRPDEIVALVDVFNREFAVRHQRSPLCFTAPATRVLATAPWRGNVRELRSVVERLHVLCPVETIGPDELREYSGLEAPAPVHETAPRSARTSKIVPRLKETRLAAARRALEVCGGNISRAAASLGVHRSTVHRWLAAEVA